MVSLPKENKIKKYSIEDMHELAAHHGGKCLSKEYVSAGQYLRWRCEHGHEWKGRVSRVRKAWCPVCTVEENKKKRRVRRYREILQIAQEQQGTCLSNEDDYVSLTKKLLFRCQQGHDWWASPDKIKQGRWCPTCAAKKRADMTRLRKYEDMQRIAKERGGKCLSPSFTGIFDKMLWECAEGHQWWAMPVLVQKGTWCRKCFGLSRRTTLAEIKEYARQKGGRCLSPSITTSSSVASFECERGHQWDATVNSVMNGSWCPACGYIEGTEKRRIYTYDSIASLVSARDGQLLSPESNYQNLQSRLRFQCDQGHQWENAAQSIVNGRWCPRCSIVGKKNLEFLQEIAKAKGGQCLSTEYIDCNIKYHWRCAKGHEWEAKYRSAKKSWCRACKNQSPRIIKGSWNQYTLETMRYVADKSGWKVLSKEYKTTMQPLKWRCDKGHEFSMAPSYVLKNSSCPICKPRKRTLEEMQKMAEKRSGQCLSTVYKNVKTKMRWRCQYGHEWEASASSISLGRWCPECRKTRIAKSKEKTVKEVDATITEKRKMNTCTA